MTTRPIALGRHLSVAVAVAVSALAAGVSPSAGAVGPVQVTAQAKRVATYWTPTRRAQAVPRDLVVDPRGRWYLNAGNGWLRPYRHTTPYEIIASGSRSAPVSRAQPGGTADNAGPLVSGRDPSDGATIGTSYSFRADVADPSGVRSVSFVITYPNGQRNSYGATLRSGTTWGIDFSGFTSGNWSWAVVAKDKANNSTTSPNFRFTVSTAGDGGGGGTSVVSESQWTGGGAIQQAAGRLIFEMPANAKRTRWVGYWCSAAVVSDGKADRSIILTAAHCTYDDANKAFARNALFIPDQAGTSGTGSDRDCSNDPLGCWVPTRAAVDSNWSSRAWPDNIPWDYGYYVVPTSGAHQPSAADWSLEATAGALDQSFSDPSGAPAFTHAFGYSGSKDPSFRYCAEGLDVTGADNWWLGSCGLTGGSSGGPWIKPLSGGTGPVMSVNSWGYTNQAGMAGPKFNGSSAECVKATLLAADLTASDGVVATC